MADSNFLDIRPVNFGGLVLGKNNNNFYHDIKYADPYLFESYFNQYKLSNPAETKAFDYEKGKGFIPSKSTEQIINKLQEITGKDLNLRPIPVFSQDEFNQPSYGWGEGGGYFSPKDNIAYVDPLKGTAYVVAHEGAHSLMPSPAFNQERKELAKALVNNFKNKINSFPVSPLEIPRDTGQRLRYVHEILAKPRMEEEARAQGVAYGLIKNLGISSTEEFSNPLEYPKTYLEEGIGEYEKNEKGPFSPNELKEWEKILRSSDPFLQRIFEQGYNLIK
jgi:hypothetical protein